LSLVVRRLASDEVAWFIREALSFAGHADPGGLALRLQRRLKDPAQDADASFVLLDAGRATAGAHVRVVSRPDAARVVSFGSVWHAPEAPEALALLVAELLRREPHEGAQLPLHLFAEERCAALAALLAPLGFERQVVTRLRFELSEVPPLGAPLVLEAYHQEDERAFRELYRRCEGSAASDARWAYLKRRSGPFRPDLWFMARETLDQGPVGYAFCGGAARGVDAAYHLDGAGVLQALRHDSEMLRRVLLSLLHELSGASPLGTVETALLADDPKLIDILASLGFEVLERLPLLAKAPA